MRRHARGFREAVKRALIRGVTEHDETSFEDGLTRRSPKLARAGVCARSCKLRREMRPRKLDETLSRHGLRARRVAFLSPRATFSLYCSPLDYLYARLKLYQKGRKAYPAF